MTSSSDGQDAEETVKCSVCGREIVEIEGAPFTVQGGDCINTEKEVLVGGVERVLRVERIVHAE